MKKFLNYAAPLALFAACLFAIYALRVQFTASIWNGYRVLAVPAAVEEQSVLQKLESYGIGDVITLSRQGETYANPIVPVTDFGKSYAEAVRLYYFDLEQKHQLYYIAEKPDLGARLRPLVKGAESGWKVEHTPPFNLLILAVPFAISALFFALSRRKLLYLFMQLPLLFFCACAPVLESTICASLFPLIAYSVQYYWKKPGWVQFLLGDLLTLAFIVAVLAVLVIAAITGSGAKVLAGGICALLASGAAVYFVYYKELARAATSFIFINSAQSCAFALKTKLQFLLAGILAVGVLALSFMAKGRFFSAGGMEGLCIPAPVEYAKGAAVAGFSPQSFELLSQSEDARRVLPDLAAYIALRWKTDVYPHVPLYAQVGVPFLGDEISVPAYKYDNASGRVSTEYKIRYTFDEAYYDSVFGALAEGTAGGVEKLLYAQGRFVAVDYKQFR